MARRNPLHLHPKSRLSSRFSTLALILGLALSGLVGWFGIKQAAAEHQPLTKAGLPTLEIGALPTQAPVDEVSKRAVVAAYEGSFDPVTRQLTVRDDKTAALGGSPRRGLNSRVDPSGEVPRDPNTGFTFTVSFPGGYLATGDLAGHISNEVQITNKTGVTLYNARVVFTKFKLCPATPTACTGQTAGTDASTTPGATGFAYYNDGQVPYQEKLHVSRGYGDIPNNQSSSAVWTFNVSTTPARFFFAFVLLADIGVAVESVQPAAVQVNANNGAGVEILGRGFTGTPTVSLVNAAGTAAGNLTLTATTASKLTATVPAGTAPGIYSLRVTNPGGTAGGVNSSLLLGRLTVTAPPDAAHTRSGSIEALTDAGPYLISGDTAINAALNVPPGTVFYVNTNARITISANGNLTACGGINGIPNSAMLNGAPAAPAQIVFTAQRSPGAALPNKGSWGGIDATAVSTLSLGMRNVVIEYGGSNTRANLELTNSGRKLQFSDGILRNSGGTGLGMNGAGEMLLGFTRNRIEDNGIPTGTAAMILSANAALGLYELPATGGALPCPLPAAALGTSVGDAIYFYNSANTYMGSSPFIQIGADINVASNDFTRSGVLVGQGETPLQLRGSSTNPAIVGAASPGAVLSITATSLLQLAPGLDLQAGDFALNLVGCIQINGFAGVNQVSSTPSANSKFVVFDKIPNATNYGAIYFSRNALSNCLLSFVQLKNGGASQRGAGVVIADAVTVRVNNTAVTGSSTGSFLEINGGVITGANNSGGNSVPTIDTVAGGFFGDGNPAVRATLGAATLTALDQEKRGAYVIDNQTNGVVRLRFLNTTRNTVTIAGRVVQPGTLATIAGGGLDIGDNVNALDADLGKVTGLTVSKDNKLVIYIDSIDSRVRAINVSASAVTVGGTSLTTGKLGTFVSSQQFGSALTGLATDPADGAIYIGDSTNGKNQIYKVPAAGGTPVTIAGNGSTQTRPTDTFTPGVATSTPLITPRAIVADGLGNVFIADSGHGRVIKVTGGSATLVTQFTVGDNIVQPYPRAPYPSGLAFHGGQLHIALGNSQQIVRMNGATVTVVAGTRDTSCDYTDPMNMECGDGGPAAAAIFNVVGSSSDPALASIAADDNGLFLCDQANAARGRIRYINRSANNVELAGTAINAGNVDTIAGAGLPTPYDDGLATSAFLSTPTGVAVEPGTGSLWITDTLGFRIRYINRTGAARTLFAGTSSEQTVQPGGIISINRDAATGQSEGDDGPVILAGVDTPQGIVATAEGIFFVDTKKGPAIPEPVYRRTSLIRFINTSNGSVSFYSGIQTITVPKGAVVSIAGGSTDTSANVGDGGSPLNAKFLGATDLAIAANGDIYVADAGNKRVRKIARATGVVSSLVLPGGTNPPCTRTPQPANSGCTTLTANQYTGLAFDPQGRLLVTDAGTDTIFREKTVGSGANANGFDEILKGGLLKSPRDLVVDAAGTFAYVTNVGNILPGVSEHRLLRLTLSANPVTAAVYAGTSRGYGGDGGPATAAQLNLTTNTINTSTLNAQYATRTLVGIALGLGGEIFFTDSVNNAIRRIR